MHLASCFLVLTCLQAPAMCSASSLWNGANEDIICSSPSVAAPALSAPQMPVLPSAAPRLQAVCTDTNAEDSPASDNESGEGTPGYAVTPAGSPSSTSASNHSESIPCCPATPSVAASAIQPSKSRDILASAADKDLWPAWLIAAYKTTQNMADAPVYFAKQMVYLVKLERHFGFIDRTTVSAFALDAHQTCGVFVYWCSSRTLSIQRNAHLSSRDGLQMAAEKNANLFTLRYMTLANS